MQFCCRHPRLLRQLVLPTLLLAILLHPMYAASSPKELVANGRVDEAVQTLEQQIRQAGDADSYNLLCRAYFMREDWDRGITACEQASSLDPQRSLYHLWLGRTYGEKADHAGFSLSAMGLAKKTRAEFERAVELDPKNWEARLDLAEFYASAPGIVGGGKEKARGQAQALASFNPAVAHYVTGQIAEKNKDTVSAEHEYRAAIEASHGTAHAWLHLAQFFRHAKRLDEMEQAMQTMESSPVDRPESLMDGASLLLHAGRGFPLAVRLLRRYLPSPVEEGPAFKAHEILGQLLEKQGDRRAAAEEYRSALALCHSYSRAQEDLKRVEH